MLPVISAWIALPVLLLLPGYCLLPKRMSSRLVFPWVLSVSVAISSLLGLLLVSTGHFNVSVLAVLELPLLIARRGNGWTVTADFRFHLPELVVFVFLAVFAFATSGEMYDGNGDSGVYSITERHLYEDGRWSWALDDLVPAEIDHLVVYSRAYAHPWREIAPGFIVTGERVSPQFLPLYPLWGAIFSSLDPGGKRVGWEIGVNLLGALLLLVFLSLWIRVFLRKTAGMPGLLLLAFNPVFLVFLTYPTAEVFLAGLLMAFIFWTCLFLAAPGGKSAVPAALMLGVGILTKFFAWAAATILLLFLLLLPKDKMQKAWPFLLSSFGAMAGGMFFSSPHLLNHFAQLRLLPFSVFALPAAAGLVVLYRVSPPRLRRSAMPVLAVVFFLVVVSLEVITMKDPSGKGKLLGDFLLLCGPLLMIAALAGLVVFAARHRNLVALFPSSLFVGLSVFLFLGSGDSAFFPFGARRFVVITIPLAAAFAGYLVSRWRRFGMILLLILVLVPVVPQWRILVLNKGRGFLSTLRALQSALPDDQPALCSRPARRYAPHLLLNGGMKVYSIVYSGVDGWKNLSEILTREKEVFLLGTDPGLGGRPVAREDRKIIRPTLSPPLTIGRLRKTFYLLKIDRESFEAPRELNIGGRDALFIDGFYAREENKRVRYRWTRPSSHVRMHGGSAIRFRWAPGRGKKTRVGVWVASERLGLTTVKPGWNWSRWFELPETGGDDVTIEIRSRGFRPGGGEETHGGRVLGVKIDRIEVRE